MRNEDRNKTIIRASVTGIAANIVLAIFKALVGLLSNSIAIILDAVNNLSDALSSVITIVGTNLAAKAPDKKHPYGYGRIEYLSTTVISVIILYAGITSLTESVKKIITPEKPSYSMITLIIVAVAVVIKITLGIYVKNTGNRVNSDSLVASGKDALMDSVISLSTLVAAIIYLASGISLEAFLGIIISIVIIKAGLDMLKETISEILGERIESSFSKQIKKTVSSIDGVIGAYDLILNNYGPEKLLGSIHIEVPDTMTADKIDILTREIEDVVYKKHGVMLSAVGIYSVNTQNNEALTVNENIRRIVTDFDSVIQMHGFYYDKRKKYISFDVVMDFGDYDINKEYEKVVNKVKEEYKDFDIAIQMDTNISD